MLLSGCFKKLLELPIARQIPVMTGHPLQFEKVQEPFRALDRTEPGSGSPR